MVLSVVEVELVSGRMNFLPTWPEEVTRLRSVGSRLDIFGV